ncbi:LCP family protein [Streptomyces sp. UH6]|uniref:LCP family protein n=1 Tax=Streptomyces sp. UH6 TaxID=2748379 RepID=UPI0015D52130|nr:LCP family protein [Streptomyces sp. UH6]NYV77446.1 LCP family protein [Streptomyces sp. UH6]
MDAHGRGRADNIDPADQWVLNPQTGEYELRLSHPAPQSPPVPSPRRPAPREGGVPRDRTAHESGYGSEAPARQRPGRDVPQPRRRRAEPEDPEPGRRRGRPKKKSKGKKILAWTGGTLAFVIVTTAGFGYWYIQDLEDNISKTACGGDACSDSFSADEAFNLLIIGTDKRTGAGNAGYGDKNSPGHADTTLLLHVAEDRSNATVMSIPRDLVTDIPDCETTLEDGTTEVVPGTANTRFNESLGQNGRDASCTARTVKEFTGIQVDHFMVADFNAVKTLTTAIDGVEVCVEEAVDDPKSHLKLPAGKSTIEGEEALAFLRTRYSFGNSGDLDRIKAQQQFLGSMMRKMSSGDTLSSPTKLNNLAQAATKALTVDAAIGKVSVLKDMALEINEVKPKNMSFMTVPVIDNPAEPTPVTVVPDPSKAPQVFQMIQEDVSFTEVKRKKKEQKDAEAARLEGSKAPASEVRVRVLNGSGKSGAAQSTLTWLQTQQGVSRSENGGNADATQKKTTLEYAPDQADQARALAAMMGLPGSALKEGESTDNAQGMPTMTLILGKDFKGAGVPLTAPTEAPEGVDKSTADKAQCAK